MSENFVIEHGDYWKSGVRVMMLVSRNKDKAEKKKTEIRVSEGVEEFYERLHELLSLASEGQRIYASAGTRNMAKAVRIFRGRQLQSEYDADPLDFYRRLSTTWKSCLMDTSAEEDKWWLMDCDTDDEYMLAVEQLTRHYPYSQKESGPYIYNSLSGKHILVKPFNKGIILPEAQKLIHKNPQMLWAYNK